MDLKTLSGYYENFEDYIKNIGELNEVEIEKLVDRFHRKATDDALSMGYEAPPSSLYTRTSSNLRRTLRKDFGLLDFVETLHKR